MTFDGKRATGVDVLVGGERKQFTAREIIVSMGGIHSPAFLMRMGIGPAPHLREQGIEVRADLPGVGAEPVEPCASCSSACCRTAARGRPNGCGRIR